MFKKKPKPEPLYQVVITVMTKAQAEAVVQVLSDAEGDTLVFPFNTEIKTKEA